MTSFNLNSTEETNVFDYRSFGVQLTKDIYSFSYLYPYVNVVHTTIQGNIISLAMIKVKLTLKQRGIKLDDSPGIIKTKIIFK